MNLSSRDRTDVNRSAILAHLGSVGPTSRADLARLLAVSPGLMTQLTKELLAEGLIQELETAPSQGGRPARMLGLVSSAGSAIGVKLVADHLAFVEVALDGTVRRSASEPWDVSDPTHITRLISLLRRFIEGSPSDRLLGIGVGVPGSVDGQSSGVVESTQLGWHGAPLGRTLREAFQMPVLVENNVNALAVAERLYGAGQRFDSFVVATVGTGVGAAIVSDGSVLRGASGGAGEIGHIPVSETGEMCRCGNRGCLETFIFERTLISRAKSEGVIEEMGAIAQLEAEANQGDERAARIFSDAGHLLGRVLAGIVNTLDPQAIIVLGEGTTAWSHWELGFEPALRSALLPSRRSISVIVEGWQDEAWAQGAAALVLGTPFDTGQNSGDQGALVRRRLVDQASFEVSKEVSR